MFDSFGNICKLSNAKSRSISAENRNGEKGKGGMATEGTGANAARELGQKWKVSPSLCLAPGETVVLADIEGPGVIRHIWMTTTGNRRQEILRMYWDGNENPSVECPVGDFFVHTDATGTFQVSSLAICVNSSNGMNSYWPMPFQKCAKITIENQNAEDMIVYYQIDYELDEVPEDCAYFHAQFRRTNPLPYKEDYVILDGVKGKGHYVGTYLHWGVNHNNWWGEGEIKFFMDGDKEFPTICGTGTEDYFCGAWNFDIGGAYGSFSSPYSGFFHHPTDQLYQSQCRFSMYRWHITDPVRFEEDLKVTIQAIGWRSGDRYLPLQDDISSVAYWYQTLPFEKFPELPDKDAREII
ncbi:MAG: DUF2961 domain-containing protein [Ruminococcaceae bacterium]|nr:DUF2961 domain-containing protein [Oscillospiraceae bacterium]